MITLKSVCVWCVQGSGCCGLSSSCSAAAVHTDTVEPNSECSSSRDRERSACWPTMEPTPTPPLCWTSVRNLNLCFLDAFSGYLKNEVFRLGLFFSYPYLITAGLEQESATTRQNWTEGLKLSWSKIHLLRLIGEKKMNISLFLQMFLNCIKTLAESHF